MKGTLSSAQQAGRKRGKRKDPCRSFITILRTKTFLLRLRSIYDKPTQTRAQNHLLVEGRTDEILLGICFVLF